MLLQVEKFVVSRSQNSATNTRSILDTHMYILYTPQTYFEKDPQSWIAGLNPTQTIGAYEKTFLDGEIDHPPFVFFQHPCNFLAVSEADHN